MIDPAARLSELREARGWSKNRLAKESGVSQSFVSEIEAGTGKPTIDVLSRLCSALGVTLAEFFTDEATGELGIPPGLRELFDVGRALSPDQRAALVQVGRVIQASGSAKGTGSATAAGDVIHKEPPDES